MSYLGTWEEGDRTGDSDSHYDSTVGRISIIKIYTPITHECKLNYLEKIMNPNLIRQISIISFLG